MHDPREVLSRPAPPPDLTAAYGDLPEQVMDVRLPPPELDGRPPVIFLHGGFWRVEWDRAHAGPLAAALAADGWPVAVVEYRRTGAPGGGWPGTFRDVAAAVRAAAGLVDRALGARGRPPAPRGAVLVGHSAGGQLALWYAGSGGHLPDADPDPGASAGVPAGGSAAVSAGDVDASAMTDAPPRAVLALAPVADLALAYTLDLDRGAVAALLGGGPADVPQRYAAADPVARPTRVPAVLLHGDLDRFVPVELSRRYVAAAGPTASLRVLIGVEHFGLIDPLSATWPVITSELRTLAHRSFSTDAGWGSGENVDGP